MARKMEGGIEKVSEITTLFCIITCLIIINLILLLLVAIKIQKDMLALFKTQDNYNQLFEKHVCKIYEIITYNNLARPKKERDK